MFASGHCVHQPRMIAGSVVAAFGQRTILECFPMFLQSDSLQEHPLPVGVCIGNTRHPLLAFFSAASSRGYRADSRLPVGRAGDSVFIYEYRVVHPAATTAGFCLPFGHPMALPCTPRQNPTARVVRGHRSTFAGMLPAAINSSIAVRGIRTARPSRTTPSFLA